MPTRLAHSTSTGCARCERGSGQLDLTSAPQTERSLTGDASNHATTRPELDGLTPHLFVLHVGTWYHFVPERIYCGNATVMKQKLMPWQCGGAYLQVINQAFKVQAFGGRLVVAVLLLLHASILEDVVVVGPCGLGDMHLQSSNQSGSLINIPGVFFL